MGNDKGRSLDLFYHVGHGKGLSRACDPKEDLVGQSFQDPMTQLFDSLGLIARRLELGDQFESIHRLFATHPLDQLEDRLDPLFEVLDRKALISSMD